MDELSAAFDEIWGTDTTIWKEVCVFETLMDIIARTSNRVFVGSALCRNPALLSHGKSFAAAVPIASAVLRQLPPFIRSIVAPVITIPNRKHTKGFARILRPEVERRLRLLNDQKVDSEREVGEQQPNDFLQWSIHRARESGSVVEIDPDIISERVLAVNFAAIHTSTFSITNVVFDLVSSDPSSRYLAQLHDEAATVLANDNGIWTKQGVAGMLKIDSTLRESLRLGSFLGVGLSRLVVHPDGVTAPNGTFCPYGSTISVPTNGVHNDPLNYPDALTYKPFRFSSQRRNEDQDHVLPEKEGRELNTDDYLKQANLSFVSTSPTYHPWGHGRHACPGRFFAANELKMLLAYIVLNYELEILPSRPESKWIGPNLVPPMQATLKVRRRQRWPSGSDSVEDSPSQ